jgi:LysM repeat protein
MGMAAIVVAFVALAWPDDENWDEIWNRLPAAAPSKPTPVAVAAATDGGTDSDGEEVGEQPLDSPVPVVEVPDTPDPESVIDELPAEGEEAGDRRPAERIDVGDGKVASTSGEQEWLIHRVAPMETVDQIAYRYGVRPDSLRMWNGIKPDSVKLREGARLKLRPRKVPPQRRKHEHWVQPGDTWWSIATMYGVDSRDLRAANWGTPQRLKVGTKIDVWIDPVVYIWVSDGTDPHVPADVRLGAVGIGPPQAGRLVNGVQLPPHQGYALKLPPSAYGTTHAVAHVVKAIDEFETRSTYEPKLMMGSMSAKHGGPLTGHRSHQSGRDLDIRLPLKADVLEYAAVTPTRVDWTALWHLIESFDATGQVVVIFFDYDLQERLYKAAVALGVDEERRKEVLQWPRGNKAHLGLVRHSPGHGGHIHVRMNCGPNEPECVSEDDFDIDSD